MSARTADARMAAAPVWSSTSPKVDLTSPHPSAKFAVMQGPEYTVVAIHTLAPLHDSAYVSQQSQYGAASHGYHRPGWVKAATILMMCQTSEAAHNYRKQVVDEDRRAEAEAKRVEWEQSHHA